VKWWLVNYETSLFHNLVFFNINFRFSKNDIPGPKKLYSINMWSTPVVWKQYNKISVLHFFSIKFPSNIYSILFAKKLQRYILKTLFILKFVRSLPVHQFIRLSYLYYPEPLVLWTSTYPSSFPDRDSYWYDRCDSYDNSKLPVVLQGPQYNSVNLEQIERVQPLNINLLKGRNF